jgi:hypothetical protein
LTNFLGLDVGQARDPSAWALVERRTYADRLVSLNEPVKVVAHSEIHATAYSRFPLRTPYTNVVRKIAAIAQTPDFYGDLVIIVDCTRERAVYDIMRENGDLHGTTIIPMIITGGAHISSDAHGWYNVPEAELLSALTVSLEGSKLILYRDGGQAPGDSEELERQLANIRKRVSPRRSRVGMSVDGSDVDNDDMAFALSFAVWYAKYSGALDTPQTPQHRRTFDPARRGLTE